MDPLKKTMLKWELAGFFFAVVFGTIMHFGLELTGFSRLTAWFFPVNESPWEHLKLSFYPILIWGLIEYAFFSQEVRRGSLRNFWYARLLGAFTAVMLVIISWSTQKAVLGKSKLVLDILLYYAGLLASSLICWRLLFLRQIWSAEKLTRWSVAGLAFFALTFVLFTYVFPESILWLDGNCHTYGMVQWQVLFDKDAPKIFASPAALPLLPGFAGYLPLALIAALLACCRALTGRTGPDA